MLGCFIKKCWVSTLGWVKYRHFLSSFNSAIGFFYYLLNHGKLHKLVSWSYMVFWLNHPSTCVTILNQFRPANNLSKAFTVGLRLEKHAPVLQDKLLDLKLVLDESIDNVVELQDCSPESSQTDQIEYRDNKEQQRETLQLLGEAVHSQSELSDPSVKSRFLF